jgi:hypothetical protein
MGPDEVSTGYHYNDFGDRVALLTELVVAATPLAIFNTHWTFPHPNGFDPTMRKHQSRKLIEAADMLVTTAAIPKRDEKMGQLHPSPALKSGSGAGAGAGGARAGAGARADGGSIAIVIARDLNGEASDVTLSGQPRPHCHCATMPRKSTPQASQEQSHNRAEFTKPARTKPMVITPFSCNYQCPMDSWLVWHRISPGRSKVMAADAMA